jgi:hypothetical protein
MQFLCVTYVKIFFVHFSIAGFALNNLNTQCLPTMLAPVALHHLYFRYIPTHFSHEAEWAPQQPV